MPLCPAFCAGARSRCKRVALTLALASPCVLSGREARAFDPYLVVPDPAVTAAAPAHRYANMSDAEALAELDHRKVLYQRVEHAAGVRAPIRLTGRLHGVYVHSSLPIDQRVTSPFEILDARLALALDDFAALLERHDVDELVHFTMYRPGGGASEGPSTPKTTRPSKPLAAKASGARRNSSTETKPLRTTTRVAEASPPAARRQTASRAEPGTRHPAGLAIDVGILHKKGGPWLSVGVSFHGHVGDKTCGDGAKVDADPSARELHAIVCEAGDQHLFTYMLTPNFNAAHVDHFHMEVRPSVPWFLYH